MAAPGSQRRRSLVPVLAALALLPLALLWPALVGDRALVGLHTGALSPWSAELSPELLAQVQADSIPLAADKTIQFQPLLAASLQRLSQGQAPLWNPHNLGGVPLLAQAFQGALYPPAWLATVLSWPRAFGWIAWLQGALAGIFAAMLLAELGVGRRAAFLGGTTYMLCGYLSVRWHWYQIHGCSMTLPLAMWGIQRLFRPGLAEQPRTRWMALAATTVAVAFALLSGWMQGAVHLVYIGAVWVVVRTVGGLREGRTRETWLAAAHCLMALVLGIALAMPQLGPTLEYVASGASARSVEPPEVVASVAMNPVKLANLVAPDLFGHPRDLARHELPHLRSRGALGQALLDGGDNDNFVESASTIGIVALLLALMGATCARPGRGLGVGLVVAGLLLALDTPLLLLVARLPGLASGDPQRFLLLSSFGGSILAALGLQRLLKRGTPRWFVVLAILATVIAGALSLWAFRLTPATFTERLADGLALHTGLPRGEIVAHSADLGLDLELLRSSLMRLTAMLALAWLALLVARRQRWLGVGALLLLAVSDQSLTGWRNAFTVPLERLFEAPPGLEQLLDDDGGRLVRCFPEGMVPPVAAPLPPNTGLPFGIHDLGGYWALAPRRIIDVFEGLEPGSTGGGLGQLGFSDPAMMEHPALDLLSVTRVLTATPIEGHGLTSMGQVGDAWLYRRPSARPRAWFTTARAVESPDQALAALLDTTADPAGPAPLEPFDGQVPKTQPGLLPGSPTPQVTLIEDLPEAVTLAVNAPAAGIVVLADNWMPGWTATLNGQPTTLWPAWHTLRAVEVPPGSHRITMTYDSPAFRLGSWISATALAILLAMGAATLRHPRT